MSDVDKNTLTSPGVNRPY